MKRRTYLASIGAGAALSGGMVLEKSENSNTTTGEENERIVYEHENLRLQTLQDSVSLGETIKFKVTNIGNSTVVLGCNNPWIIQEYSDDEWHNVTDKPQGYSQLCALELPPGESRVESATMLKDELEKQTGNLLEELHPGRYRFVLLKTDPQLAVDFHITSSK